VVSGLTDAASKMKLGQGIDPTTELGPVVSQEQLERVMGYIKSGKREGATSTTGGERASGDLAQGYFVQPTIFDSVRDDMTIAREEIFGPVVVALPFEEVEEAGQSHLIDPSQNALEIGSVPASLETLGLDTHARRVFLA
jgi:acyl-CoA reductase-like NAD-dependent aldehyde dehydrogenase